MVGRRKNRPYRLVQRENGQLRVREEITEAKNALADVFETSIERLKETQNEIALAIGVTQSKVSEMKTLKADARRLDTILRFLLSTQCDVEIRVSQSTERYGSLSVADLT